MPAFSEEDIEALVGRRRFRQGWEYHRDGAIVEPQREGQRLRAACIGSGREPYYVEARFDEQRLRDSRCSCPMGHAGNCKHVAALLITWCQTPKAFVETESWERLLNHCNRRDLIEIVKQLADHRPETQRLIEPLLPGEPRDHSPATLEVQRRQIAEAVAQAEPSVAGRRRLLEQLLTFKSEADDLCAQRELADAASVYHALLEELAQRPDRVEPREADWAALLGDSIEMLSLCLPVLGDDLDARQAIFRTLLRWICLDAVGGVPAPAELSRLLLAETRREERKPLAEAIQALLPSCPTITARRALGGLLLQLVGAQLNETQWIDVCRRCDRVLDLVERHLAAGRAAEALEEAGKAQDDELLDVAAVLARWGRAAEGRRLVEQRLAAGAAPALSRWLEAEETHRKHLMSVLEQTYKLFRLEPSWTLYCELRSVARQVGQWDKVRPTVIETLQTPPLAALLVRILLDEHELGAALQLVAGDPALIDEGSLAIRVARAAAETRPDAAATIYQALARRLIAARGRQNYLTALAYLRKARGLWKRAGNTRQWQECWNELLRSNRALRTFYAELRAPSEEDGPR